MKMRYMGLACMVATLLLSGCATDNKAKAASAKPAAETASGARNPGWDKDVGGPRQSLDEKADELRRVSQETAPPEPARRPVRATGPADNPMDRVDNQLRAIDSQRR